VNAIGKSQCKYCITGVQTHLLKRHEGVCKKTAVLCPAQGRWRLAATLQFLLTFMFYVMPRRNVAIGCSEVVPKDARVQILKEDSSSNQPFNYSVLFSF
jgi:hypothetical protein